MLYRKIEKHYLYELKQIETFIVDLPDLGVLASVGSIHGFITCLGGVLTIQKHYQWDGSTIPLKKWYKWIFDSDKYCKVASLCHDALYQLMRNDLIDLKHKNYIDTLYGEMCVKGGMGKRQADMRVWALKKFAKIEVVTEEEQEILEAI